MSSEQNLDNDDLLSAIHGLINVSSFPTSSIPELHLFAESHGDSSAVLPQLRNIVNVTSLMSLALSSHEQMTVTDPKLVSLMRQKATINHELNIAESTLDWRIKALRERRGVEYGEDIISGPNFISWFLQRIEQIAKSAGMDVFCENESSGKVTATLAGKVIVLDIEFHIKQFEGTEKIVLSTLKSTHAAPVDAPATSTSTLPTSGVSLDTFLITVLQHYLSALQKTEAELDNVQVARLGESLQSHLRYIMKLDNLAQRQGSRWFTEVDDLYSAAAQIVPKEAASVARNLELPKAPLDILLLRGHALPIPYLSIPSLSFLLYLSPITYLGLLSSCPPSTSGSTTDIPMQIVRAYFAKNPVLNGSVMASLSLQSSSQPSNLSQIHSRPVFPLIAPMEPSDEPDEPDIHSLDYILPIDNGPDAWILDLGDEGIVMSQSRMWEIQMLLGQAPNDSMPIMSFAYSGSWVDLLVQHPEMLPNETYEATYVSPTNSHPPLHLRLTAPQEPGFILRKIRVQSLRQIWSIFEIVKEQAWYNSLIKFHQWKSTALANKLDRYENGHSSLDSLLNGTHMPKQIPVSIYIEAPILPTMFEPSLNRMHPTVSLVFPSKELNSTLIKVDMKPDMHSTYGFQLAVNGYSAPKAWVEAVRRGAGFAIAGRCWMMQGSSQQFSI